MDIYISDILYNTTSDGEGFRNSIYVTGCDLCCPGCHNKHLWDKKNGTLTTVEEVYKSLNSDETNNISFLGGEPTCQAKELSYLADMIKSNTNKTIWVYSGRTFDEILTNEAHKDMILKCDVLVDGRFNQDYYVPNLKFRGSTNQRIIDIQKTLMNNEITLWVDPFEFVNDII